MSIFILTIVKTIDISYNTRTVMQYCLYVCVCVCMCMCVRVRVYTCFSFSSYLQSFDLGCDEQPIVIVMVTMVIARLRINSFHS